MSSDKHLRFKLLLTAAVASVGLAALAPPARAQISIHIGPGGAPPPLCPYGYYDYPPYPCAPYGYYGPEWFIDGVFIGAGPWYHGPRHFHGYVDNHFDPRHGYHGHLPRRGEHRTHGLRGMHDFHGNEMRDGRGHSGGPRH
jgi:hypothetical protein